MTEEGGTRIEHDSLGEVAVPTDALWQAQTQRAVDNFPVSGEPMPAAVVRTLARIKAAAATANLSLGNLDDDTARAVRAAALEVASGEHAEQFPIDVFQTGSGTSTNMNVNEVVATLAGRRLGRRVHPNDVVNAGQSSNDTFPTAVHVAVADAAAHDLLPALELLATTLRRRAADYAETVKSGRTHLMDATPVTFGQEIGAWATQVELGHDRVASTLPRVCALPLGGTAVGTGLNAPPGFAAAVIGELAEAYGLPFTETADHMEAQASRDSLVELSGQLRVVAVSLTKVCNDLRWLGSGPAAGLAEIHLADLQPGSSIMPGKVNPVVPEAVLQVCTQVVGNDAAIAWAGASGSFQLNVQIPVMARNLLQSLSFLGAAVRLLDSCVETLEADPARMLAYAEGSSAVVTALNTLLGYDEAATVAKQAKAERRSVREIIEDRGYVTRGVITEAELDSALDVLSMTRPPA
jgi:fumarate hydratase, class II